MRDPRSVQGLINRLNEMYETHIWASAIIFNALKVTTNNNEDLNRLYFIILVPLPDL